MRYLVVLLVLFSGLLAGQGVGQGFTLVTGGAAGAVDSTRLVQDSILVYYAGSTEIRRDTLRGLGSTVEGVSVVGPPETLLLDSLGIPEIAFSCRTLKSSSSNFGRIRRSSDNAIDTLKFSEAGTISLESEMSSGGTLRDWSSGQQDVYLVEWFNQGSGGNALQGNQAQQPLIVRAGNIRVLNGKPAVFFNDGQYLQNTSIALSQPSTWSLSIGFEDESVDNDIPLDSGPSGASRQIPLWLDRTGGQFVFFAGANTNLKESKTNKQILSQVEFKTSGSISFINGQEIYGINAAGSNGLSGITLGARFSGTSGLKGHIQEVIAWDDDKSTSREYIREDAVSFYVSGNPSGLTPDNLYPERAGEPQSFTFLKRLSNVGASQGVAADRESIYVTGFPPGYTEGHDWIMKYDYNGNQIAANSSATTDGFLQATQVNGIDIQNSRLYISSNNYIHDASPGSYTKRSAVKVYDAETLEYITEYEVNPDICEGYSWKDGYWWGVYNDLKVITQRNENFDLVDTYPLTYSITTGSTPFYYQSIVWVDDYILCTVHEGTSTPNTIDVYRWNGSGFDEVRRIDQINPSETGQGVYSVRGTNILWWTERSWPNVENNLVMTRMNFVNPSTNN